ncbi:MFS transporter [Amycolatopsis anabasis]|uniref:MFS transporter n=1 Tax=Amycolatopsis anabasis TaxID=1840409 RepID=UPI00131EC391|nr:MFS transporter [Amycolatopsis anabasis]
MPAVQSAPPEAGTDPRRWRALFVLALAQFMILIDNSVVNVALPTVQRDLGFSPVGLGWVVNAYVLAAGGLLLLGGRLGDLLGRRRTFIAGIGVFALASLLCGLAWDPAVLVGARFAQGIGEALASPAALSMIALLFPEPAARAKAFGVWAGVTGTAATAGVLLSGVITELANWRWLFLINLPVAAFAAFRVVRLTAESRASTGGRIDVPGAILVTGGLLALVDGLLAAATHAWASPRVLVPLVAGTAALTGFVVVERRTAHPLLPLSFFGNRIRLLANLLNVVLAIAMTVFFFLFTLYLQDVLGFSALWTGLAYLPFCAVTLAGYAASAQLMKRLGLRAALTAGFVLGAAGMCWLSWLPAQGSFAAQVLPGTLLLGFGLGTCFPALAVAALHGVTGDDAGIGSGVQTTVYQLGGALGLATFVTVALRRQDALAATGMPEAAAAAAGYRLAFAVLAALFAVAAGVAVLLRERS